MRKINLMIMLISASIIGSCSKDIKDIRIVEYLSKDSTGIIEMIQKDRSFNTLDTIHIAIARFAKEKKIDSIKNFKLLWLIEQEKEYRTALQPRLDILNLCIEGIKNRAKNPSSVKIVGELGLTDNDDIKIYADTLYKTGEYYKAEIKYLAANGFGNLLDGVYQGNLKRDSSGKLVIWYDFMY